LESVSVHRFLSWHLHVHLVSPGPSANGLRRGMNTG
jgi:hypothetical protein